MTRPLPVFACLLACLLVGGCGRVLPPTQGGEARALGIASLRQSEAPEGVSAQEVEREAKVSAVLPVEVVWDLGEAGTIVLPAGTVVLSHVREKSKQTLGGAWKDKGREIAAKMAGMSDVRMAGVGLMALGAFAFASPWARKLLGGGKYAPAAIIAVGAACTFGTALLPGNERLILVGGGISLGVLWLVARAAHKETQADELAKQVEKLSNPGDQLK